MPSEANHDIVWACIVTVLFALAALNTRAAYRNGCADGWRACRDRADPLWREVRAHIRSVDWHERDMVEEAPRAE